jgi:fermentation-respiration switch protein FrsA (DUF1100 family)
MLAKRITVTRQQHFFRKQFEHGCGKILSVFTIFQSEGLKVIGNLFIPQDFKEGDVSLPAVLIAGAMTGVKEQSYSNSTPATICYLSRLFHTQARDNSLS